MPADFNPTHFERALQVYVPPALVCGLPRCVHLGADRVPRRAFDARSFDEVVTSAGGSLHQAMNCPQQLERGLLLLELFRDARDVFGSWGQVDAEGADGAVSVGHASSIPDSLANVKAA